MKRQTESERLCKNIERELIYAHKHFRNKSDKAIEEMKQNSESPFRQSCIKYCIPILARRYKQYQERIILELEAREAVKRSEAYS